MPIGRRSELQDRTDFKRAEYPAAEIVRIRTPENIELFFKLSGMGSRSLAYLVDLSIRFLAFVIGFWLLSSTDRLSITPAFLKPYVITTWILVSFLVQWCYFTFFEAFWKGQTPGKRILRLRVMSEKGCSAGFMRIALRNLVRVIDFLPFAYTIGLLSLFLSARNQRLGDIIAGTIVTKEEPAVTGKGRDKVFDEEASLPAGEPDSLEGITRSYEERVTELDEESRERLRQALHSLVATEKGGLGEPSTDPSRSDKKER